MSGRDEQPLTAIKYTHCTCSCDISDKCWACFGKSGQILGWINGDIYLERAVITLERHIGRVNVLSTSRIADLSQYLFSIKRTSCTSCREDLDENGNVWDLLKKYVEANWLKRTVT